MSRRGMAARPRRLRWLAVLALGLVACGDGRAPATPDAALDATVSADAAPDATSWPPRLLEWCGDRDPGSTLEPGLLTRGVNAETESEGLVPAPGDVVAAGFSPPHAFRLERLRLRLTGQGAITVAVWGDYMRELPDPDQVLVPPQRVEVSGEAWYVVEGFVPPLLEPLGLFWVAVTFEDGGVEWLVGRTVGGWDRLQLAGLGLPPGQWARSGAQSAVAVHAEGRYQCPIQQPWFVDRRGEAGIAGEDLWFLQLADLDGDGREDFVGVNGDTLVAFRNLGGLRFGLLDVTTLPGAYHFVLTADVDGDGDQDVYLGRSDPPWNPDSGLRPLLLVNDGTGALTVRPDSGLEVRATSALGAFADFNGDGHLDLYVGNLNQDEASYQADLLFRGSGDGAFTEVSQEAGLQALPAGPTFGVNWCDLDGDGRPDLLLAQANQQPNRVWWNRGDGTFSEVAAALGLAQDPLGVTAGYSLALECGDYDNDGDQDVMVGENTFADQPEVDPPRLLRAAPGGPNGFQFEDVTRAAGIPPLESMFDPSWADFDNDGDLDLFVCSEGAPTQSARLYRNEGDGTFTDVTYDAGLDIPDGVTGSWADFDGDGDLDLLTYSRQRGTLLLYENRLGAGPRWIQLRLQGVPPSNRDALGARIIATTGELIQTRELSGAWGSRINNSSRLAHFGFGGNTAALEVTVRWPSGRVERFDSLPENTLTTVVEGTGSGAGP